MAQTANNQNPEFLGIAEDGKKIFRWKAFIKITCIILGLILLLSLFLYWATDIALNTKSFPITLVGLSGDGAESLQISLSEDAEGKVLSTHLKAPVIEEMWDMSSFDIPADVDSGEGCHNGTDYIAYTFYLRNASGLDGRIEEKMEILAATKGAEEAVRVRVYRDGVAETYAKAAKSGEPEYGTLPFSAEDRVYDITSPISGGQVTRYTIVIWLEGDDPECVDDVRGGMVRIAVRFTVLDSDS